MIRRSRSVAESTTSVAQKNDAIAASAVKPNVQKQAATRMAVASSTAGYRQEISVLQVRQRPRRSSQETTGMLSRHESSVPQLMHADGGDTTERCSGTRAATTFRNDPM